MHIDADSDHFLSQMSKGDTSDMILVSFPYHVIVI